MLVFEKTNKINKHLEKLIHEKGKVKNQQY